MSEGSDAHAGFCPVCGSPLAEGAQFCGACGSHVPSPYNPYDAPTTPEGIPSESVAQTVPGIAGFIAETSERCLSCGAALIPGADRCGVCGAPVLGDDTLWPSEPGHNGHQT